MGALQSDVFRRNRFEKEKGDGEHCRVLLVGSPKGDPARKCVVADLDATFKNGSAFVLPPTGRVIHIRQRYTIES